MDNNIIPIVTSFIAIIVACISGFFSYFSSRQSSKVQAMQAYLTFLQHKMTKLEEALQSIYNGKDKKNETEEDTKEEDTDNNYKNLEKVFYRFDARNIRAYSYLFTHDRRTECDRLIDISSDLALKVFVLNDNHGLDIEKEREFYNSSIDEIKELSRGLNKLLLEELDATYKIFEQLSLPK